MKLVKIVAGVLVLAVAAVFLSQLIASETAEVVVLTTESADGPAETRLWVVEHDGLQYLRADAGSGWYGRLKENPSIILERQGESARYMAEVRPVGDVVNSLMNAKYGWRDEYIEWMIGGREEVIAVALLPVN